MEAGRDGYFNQPKPVDPAELLAPAASLLHLADPSDGGIRASAPAACEFLQPPDAPGPQAEFRNT